MRIETRNNGIRDYQALVADEGKWLRRISDGFIYGEEIALGYSYYIGGKELENPHLDIENDFEEVGIEDVPAEETPEDIDNQ